MVTVGRVLATVLSAGLRAAAAVASGLLLCGGIGLLLWSITPDSGSDATELLRGSVVALAAGHFLPVTIGGAAVTIHPLLVTVIVVAVIASSAGRARPVRGRTLEALHGTVFAVGYAILLDLAVSILAPTGAVGAGLLAPLLIAVVGVLAGLAWHRTSWSRWWRVTAPKWAQAGVRAGFCAAFVLVAAGAVALAVGLATSLPDAVGIGGLTGGSAGDAFGQFVLCLALLPNAVVAAVGYVTGAGFTVGGASFSPLAVHQADLPAIPLLAATPDGAPSTAALLVFVGPLLAVAAATMVVVRTVHTRSGRLLAVVTASAVAGALVVALAAVAGGGVAGGPWSTSGVPLLVGVVVAGMLLVVSGAGCAVAGWSQVPWRARSAHDAEAGEGDEEGEVAAHRGKGGDEAYGPGPSTDTGTDTGTATDGAADEVAGATIDGDATADDGEAQADDGDADETIDEETPADAEDADRDADGEPHAAEHAVPTDLDGDAGVDVIEGADPGEVCAIPDADGDQDDDMAPGPPADRVRADPAYGTELFPDPTEAAGPERERPATPGAGDLADAG